MKLNIINIRKSINKAFLKVKPNRIQIENFKKNILSLYDQINESESEEYHKNIISKFLSDTYYSPNHYINTKGRTDLVIHNGKDSSSTVGVLIETKKPSNKSEMPTKDNLNAKALQELILYYLRERISGKNIEVKHLIVTNIYEWFIFNANDFDRLFAQNKKLVKQFTDFEEGRLADTKTEFFYKQIAEPFLNDLDSEISFTYLDIRNYEKIIKNNDKLDDNKLVALFKLFSPENLLKLPFANDSNSLDKGFYSELLHLIGLQETKEGSKKLIGRKSEKERNAGSLIENTITILKYEDCLSQIKASDYGTTKDDQLYNVALELVITWINRVLFLKLLEGQLIKYHSGDKSFKFLNIERIPDFDALNKLFFQVLAIKENERNDMVKQKFGNIPYLNSSLFEPNDLEHKTVRVSNLEDEYSLPILNSTILKDKTGKKQSGELNTLEYLFAFLDSYDFASEGAEEIQEENKTLINASVLGLIFEKINGYKDGSFFTPGFITMHMCRETIRRAVVQKFNETKNWNCKTIDDVYNKIDDIQESNKIINDLKICDPAVGSGHFLVSALNEIIAIKNDLRILSDREGKRLKEYQVEVVNDELVVTDEDGELFEYNPKNKENQRIQETLFHEKQTIIENCLFGVDINPNSVKICRLRLWIELLKNAYYKSGTEELETLPNIDINIKCGNSLISRYALDADIKKALKKSKWTIDSYRLAVMTYRNAQSKEEKRSMEKLIDEIKNDFESEIADSDKRLIKLNKLKGELFAITNQQQLFDQSKTEKTNWNKKVKKLTDDISKLENELEEIRTNKIYEDAFEWRFEFPEVLNDEGDFIGFDVVIGNPPYGLFNKKQNQKIALQTDALVIEQLKNKFPEATGGVINAARIFYAFGFTISSNFGYQSMIIPYGVLTDTTSVNLRKHIFTNHSLIKVEAFPERDNTNRRVFEDVKMSTAILITSTHSFSSEFDIGISYERMISQNRSIFNIKSIEELNPDLVQIPLTDTASFNILHKIYHTKNVVIFGQVTPCLTGEVDMTFAKKALTDDTSKNKLFKGVQIDRYILKTNKEDISQGEIEYIDYDIFSNICSEKKLHDAKMERLVLQGLTGVNEKRRLKATILKGEFIANSCNYLLQAEGSSLYLMLAWLNSKLLNFIFKTRSTSSNVNGYEVDNLPIINSSQDKSLIDITKNILDLRLKDNEADILELENNIDKIIYELFDLKQNEIEIIEEISK